MIAFLRLEAHRSEYHHGRAPAGRATSGPEISVDTDDERSFVRLTLDPLPGETFDDRDVDRIFTADEDASNHCQIGNLGLAVRFGLAWLNHLR